ncbi:MAG TPA: RNA methyltransferase [Edaphocola sp.]|nr:RNA methyltransferase [Edaphocola sp.]
MSQKFKKKTMPELQRLSNEEAQHQFRFPLIIVLDNVRSMNNVGSVFRTADSFGLQEIIICGFTPQPPHREIHKTALGATDTVKWTYYENVTEALEKLKQEEYKILAAEQTHNSVSLETIQYESIEKKAVIFGNEVVGVSDEALTYCDEVIEIPQFGAKHSLNISVSVGIVCWELIRNFHEN